jgi:hypothetical protein
VFKRSQWLCIAYAFPPINRSGTHRTLGFVHHLDQHGWDATVLTVVPGDEPLDETLCSKVPPRTRVIRTRWSDPIAWLNRSRLRSFRRNVERLRTEHHFLSAQHLAPAPRSMNDFARWMKTPDSRVGWFPWALAAGIREIRRHQPRVIFSTSPYPTAHLIALALHEITRIPWVADFRDPWCGNPFLPPTSRGMQWSNEKLEQMVLRRATHALCNSPSMTTALLHRHPFLEGKCSTVLNGFDSGAFHGIKPRRAGASQEFVLVHAGQFYGPRVGRHHPRTW